MKRYPSIFFSLGFVIFTACPRLAASEADARALRDEVAAFVRDWSGMDAGRIAAHYADDGNLIVPNSPTMTGKDAIGKAMKNVVADPNWSLAMQPVQVEVSTAAISGTLVEPMCSRPLIP